MSDRTPEDQVNSVRAWMANVQKDLDSRAIRSEDARYCWQKAVDEVGQALDGVRNDV